MDGGEERGGGGGRAGWKAELSAAAPSALVRFIWSKKIKTRAPRLDSIPLCFNWLLSDLGALHTTSCLRINKQQDALGKGTSCLRPALLTLLRMMLPSWLCSLVAMSNMAPPSPGTMVYSTSAFFPMSRSWALILPTTDPSADDSGTRRWKKPVEQTARRHAGARCGDATAKRFDSDSFHVASRCTSRHAAAAAVTAAYAMLLYDGRASRC